MTLHRLRRALLRLPLELRLFLALLTTILIVTTSMYGLVLLQARNYAEDQLRQTLQQELTHLGPPGSPLGHRLRAAAQLGGGWGVWVTPGEPPQFTDGLQHPGPPPAAVERARQGLPAEYRTPHALVRLRAVPGGVVGLSADLDSISDFVLRLCRLNLLIAAVLVTLACSVGVILIRLGLRPLRRITAQARGLSASRLHQRLAVPESHDDVRALAQSLNGMLDRLDQSFSDLQAEEARTRAFAADASHELRTPLTALSGYLEVLARAPENQQMRLELLLSARREADRAGRLVEDLLTLTRLDSGETFRPEPLEVRGWLVQLVGRVQPIMPEHRVVIEVQGLTQLWVHADPLRLEQALWNLLRNAARHAPHGSTISVQAVQQLDAVTFEVQDEGPGFTSEGLQRGFERFYRAQRDPIGAGLGLAIVQSIAQAHGGSAGLGNRPNGGAWVRFTAPAWPRRSRLSSGQ
ncbi:sensor histidine kinase [Deinococcus hopiensis]|uniref:histidine kinase n=1 Tax=Deinococcus hopiensis KR-140 TaxID=695939 RepID=A0A1W1VV02_9DEIO|nr:ATP-binding protein [Deinococcus hopiensis]SMB97156.1 two-component system, OmpR family, sensor kinase [Deinococcus hopiensis KR-140]